MPKIPLPNWRIDFTGLSKIPALKKNFQSITLSHGYSSVYSIGNYTSSLEYNSNYVKPGRDFLSSTPQADVVSSSGNIIPVYIINEVNIRESFSPLIGINIRTKGKWTYRFEYRRSRNLSLSLTNAQLRDETSQDFVIGIGYLKTGVKIPKIFTRGKTKTLKNELNARVDFTLRDSKGVQRSFDQSSTVTAGAVNWQVKPTITYNLSSRVTLQLYFERTFNNPKISSSYKRTTTSVGLQLRFTLS
jgi:cell surface protein SprA